MIFRFSERDYVIATERSLAVEIQRHVIALRAVRKANECNFMRSAKRI